jgi:hypothetical protein
MPYNLEIPGWMPANELKIIERLAATIPKDGRMVEVGPFCGRSSWCWSKSADPSVKISCLDIWKPKDHPFAPPAAIGNNVAYNEFGRAESKEMTLGSLENFKYYTRKCENIETFQGASPYDFRDWDEPQDLVFLDAVHHNPAFWDDLNFWFWKVKPGGLCCGHDFARSHPDTVWSVQDFAKKHGLMFFVEARIWIIPRPPCRRTLTTLFEGL